MITSLDNKKVKEWTKLHQKKYRDSRYLLLSEELVKAAYKAECLDTLVYTGEIPFEFPNSYDVTVEVLNKIKKDKEARYIGVGKFIKEKKDYKQRVLILDELQDPLNIGRIIELTKQFGFDSIILSENCADYYHEKALEASKGALYEVGIYRGNIFEEIKELKNLGFKIYATGLRDQTKDLSEVKVEKKMAIVLGNEGSGVRKETFDLADETIKIDMKHIDSLNVAMAAAIVMYRFSI